MENKKTNKREFTGLVVSDKMDKTVVVKITTKVLHPLYKKYVTKSVKYKAHDENNEAKIGDTVRIMECRPISKEKCWNMQEIVERAK
ncbi:MAG: 30S ribosomal protein S17 [Spirochaetales bacterium]|nr:30S ribosomal protein S17 [Spirochaetales bacterium]